MNFLYIHQGCTGDVTPFLQVRGVADEGIERDRVAYGAKMRLHCTKTEKLVGYHTCFPDERSSSELMVSLSGPWQHWRRENFG